MIDAVCIRDPVYRVGGLEWEKGEIDYVRRKILLVCVCFSLYLSCQRKLDIPCDWEGV